MLACLGWKTKGLIHTKLLTFGYSVFPSLLELDLTASALSSTPLSFAVSLLQDHPSASFCTDPIGRLLQCPSAFTPSPLPCEDEMQANATSTVLCSVLCLIGLSRSWRSATPAACTLLTLGNQDTTQRRHQAEQGCRCGCIKLPP